MKLPTGAINLATIKTVQQIRLGIQGFPGVGKTWTATTFPNPIFLNLDRGLGAHTGREGIYEIPMWDDTFSVKLKPSKKEAILHWLTTEGKQLESDCTLILDGSTGLQNAFDHWSARNPQYTKQGKIDDFAHWRLKKEYFAEIAELLKTFRCHVIYLAHEAEAKDKDGGYTGKVRPLLTGQFGDELGGHFTDWFRQHAAEKTLSPKEDTMKAFGMNAQQWKEMCDSFNAPSIYYWQTFGDDRCDCKASSLVGQPKYMKADYITFCQYMKKPVVTTA